MRILRTFEVELVHPSVINAPWGVYTNVRPDTAAVPDWQMASEAQ